MLLEPTSGSDHFKLVSSDQYNLQVFINTLKDLGVGWEHALAGLLPRVASRLKTLDLGYAQLSVVSFWQTS